MTITSRSEPAAPTAAPASRLADPGPWAVTAFATTSFMLGMYNAGLLKTPGVPIVIPVAFFFGGLVQIIVAVLEIGRGNTFGAVVFGTYGPFWVIFGAFQTLYATSIPTANLGSSVALFLAVFAVVSLYFTIAALRVDAVLVAILFLIMVGLALLSAGYATGDSWATKSGGWVTLVFAVLAWYHAAGDLISFTFGRQVLPFGNLKKS